MNRTQNEHTLMVKLPDASRISKLKLNLGARLGVAALAKTLQKNRVLQQLLVMQHAIGCVMIRIPRISWQVVLGFELHEGSRLVFVPTVEWGFTIVFIGRCHPTCTSLDTQS